MSIPIIGKEEDVAGCVSAPVLLQEILRSCSESEPLKKPIDTMLQILAEFAHYVSVRDEPALNIIALRLGLFPMPNDRLRKALDYEFEKLKAISDVDGKKAEASSEGEAETKILESGCDNG